MHGGQIVDFFGTAVASKVCVYITVQGKISLGVDDETIIENTFEVAPNFLQGVSMSLARTYAITSTCVNCISTLWMSVVPNVL